VFGVARNYFSHKHKLMILLQRTRNSFGQVDGSAIRPDTLACNSLDEIKSIVLETDSGHVSLRDVFDASTDRMPLEPFLVIEGGCESIEGLGSQMQSGTICILGDVGDNTARGMAGGSLVISGNARDHLGAGMADGLIYVAGNCRHGLASPLPGKKSGMRGGDILVTGNIGDRACERQRRGTVFVAGDAGSFCAAQMIAGTLVVMGDLGGDWAGGMRRGSLILGRDCSSKPSASLSEPRDFELSFLPLIWRHIANQQNDVFTILNLAIAFARSATTRTIREPQSPIKIPRTRWVQRQIADINCKGKGEVLVLKRVSSPSVVAS
jgi:formylmethanofuran dehydrogenase subunit C